MRISLVYDELAEQLATAEARLEQVLRSGGRKDGSTQRGAKSPTPLADALRP